MLKHGDGLLEARSFQIIGGFAVHSSAAVHLRALSDSSLNPNLQDSPALHPRNLPLPSTTAFHLRRRQSELCSEARPLLFTFNPFSAALTLASQAYSKDWDSIPLMFCHLRGKLPECSLPTITGRLCELHEGKKGL
ncbi:hypothetical protein K1719_042522 [Acacia pycnantha]|nr:hypothetical protein K1719_042522 [Acacia pycnantha]